ncbi:hypothetical protein [Clostridium gasigenes]|nr:hypothetical protein [Clostridium gasigenes]
MVAGLDPGKGKIAKAEELNTKIITEEEFFYRAILEEDRYVKQKI